MLEIINELSQDSLGMVIMGLMGLVLLLFFLWFGFFAVGLPLGALISGTKLTIRRRHKRGWKYIPDNQPAIDSEPYPMSGKLIQVEPIRGRERRGYEESRQLELKA